MKKQFLILAGSALILASCGSNENTDSANQQAQIDSIAAANAALQDEINKKRNDSAINATATAMADSIRAAEEAAAAASAKKGGTKKKATPPPAAPAPPPPPPPPPTVGQGKPKMGAQPATEGNKESNTVGQGKPKMGK